MRLFPRLRLRDAAPSRGLREMSARQSPRTQVKPKRFSSGSLRLGGLVASCALVTGVVACADQPPAQPTSRDFFGFSVPGPIPTSNPSTQVGAASAAHELAARLYPGPYTVGPKGQFIPNLDLASGQLLPGVHQKRAIYTINAQARYSDGAQVTCDDFLLAHVAGTMPELFGSHLPMMTQIDHVDCGLGSKEAIAVFKPGFGARWRQLFTSGTLLPSHAIAAKAGLSTEQLHQALVSRDAAALGPVATAWNQGFQLAPEAFDPALQVSSGPYKIDKVESDGEVTLVANEQFHGEAPLISPLVIWPGGQDQQHEPDGAIRVADATSLRWLDWINRDDRSNPYQLDTFAGVLTDTLVLASEGTLAPGPGREAFAACVDQQAIARASSEASGVEVPAVLTRTARAADPVVDKLADITDPHRVVNIDLARRLQGRTIDVGYVGPDARKKAMVEALARSCQPAGITIRDASANGGTYADLRGAGGTQSLDALLVAVDPMDEYAENQQTTADVLATRDTERRSWGALNTIPLASQPRAIAYDRSVNRIAVNSDRQGLGWNLDRWVDEGKQS